MVVDPGDEAERILARIRERGVTVARILHTHGHFDHIGATEALLAGLGAPVPVLAHPADAYLYTRESRGWGEQFGYPLPEQLTVPDSTIADGMLMEVGTLRLRVIATPGHTPGSVSLLCEPGGVSATADAGRGRMATLGRHTLSPWHRAYRSARWRRRRYLREHSHAALSVASGIDGLSGPWRDNDHR